MTKAKHTLDIDLDEEAGAPAAPPEETIVDEDGPVAVKAAEDPDIVDEDLDPEDRLPAHAILNADGSVTLPLDYPRTIKSKKRGKIKETVFNELVFHRLNGADQNAIRAASEESAPAVAFARSTRIHQAVMNALYDKMDSADLTAGGQVLNNFLTSGRKTGRRSSAD